MADNHELEDIRRFLATAKLPARGAPIDLSRKDLSGADFAGRQMSGARLSGAKLVKARLARAQLSEADLFGADLAGADLQAADLRKLICPLQSGPKVNLDWTLKETEHGQEARA